MQRLVVLAVCLALARSAAAHDVWLVPATPSIGPGESMTLSLRVGMDFPASTNAADPARLTAYLLGPDGSKIRIEDWSRDDGAKLTETRVAPQSPGLYLATVQSEPSKIELAAQDFNLYLLHDGLPQVLARRLADGEADRDATERYSRHLKAVFRVGPGASGDAELVTRPAGLKLEIVPLADPTRTEPGRTLAVRVLFDGQPLPDALLCWDLPGTGEGFVGSVMTDEQGEAVVPVAGTGLMTLRLVHMTRPKAQDYEWESFWTSLTFHVPPARADR